MCHYCSSTTDVSSCCIVLAFQNANRQSPMKVPLDTTITVCLNSPSGTRNRCLGYYDPASHSWTCEDECLQQRNSTLCGRTGHLTVFAILLGGGGGGSYGYSGVDPCSPGERYFTGAYWSDSVVVAISAGTILALCCCMLLFSLFPCGRRFILGAEAMRIRQVRELASRIDVQDVFADGDGANYL